LLDLGEIGRAQAFPKIDLFKIRTCFAKPTLRFAAGGSGGF